MGCPRTFPRSKPLNLSFERAFGAYTANQDIDVATQHNICPANQDTAEHSTISVQPIRSEKIKAMEPRSPTFRRVSLKGRRRLYRGVSAYKLFNEYTPRACQLYGFYTAQ
jgi:hypothetical protein